MGNIYTNCCNPRNVQRAHRNEDSSFKFQNKPLNRSLPSLSQANSFYESVKDNGSAGSSRTSIIKDNVGDSRLSLSNDVNYHSRKTTYVINDSLRRNNSTNNKEKDVEPLKKSLAIKIPQLAKSDPKYSSEIKILSLFNSYRDSKEDAMLSHGIEKFCIDLEVRPEEFKVLVLAWKCNVDQMCRISRQEFLIGCRALKVDSIPTLKTKLSEAAIDVVHNKSEFKDLYRFTFKFGLEIGQKVLPIEMAVNLWQLVFSQDQPPLLSNWINFLQKMEIRGIPRDTWNMFLNLIESLGNDLSTYDDNEAWPSLFDDFVEFEKDRNQ